MNSAIIQIVGKQYRVNVGDEIVVDRIPESAWTENKLSLTDVVMSQSDKATKIGAPFVDGAKVTLELVKNQRGTKLVIFQFKAKSRYRRHRGHRQEQTVVKVASITA